MSYATRQAMIDRFGEQELIQLTDNTKPPSGGVNDDALNLGIADAEALINGYIGSRYSLPLSVVPVALTRVACDLARYFLCRRPTEEMVKRYDQAIAWLRDVAKGTVSIGLTSTSKQPETTGGPQTSADDRIFNKETLGDY